MTLILLFLVLLLSQALDDLVLFFFTHPKQIYYFVNSFFASL
jgi:hypothetical protein